jgi:vacuolar-type H+-ATPase subunit H
MSNEKINITASWNERLEAIEKFVSMDWIQKIAFFRTEEGQLAKGYLNQAVNIMKSGIGEYLWIQFKEDLNDFDSYMAAVGGLMDKLKDGYLTDQNGSLVYSQETNPDGTNKLIIKWLPTEVQYTRVLKPLADDLGFTMDELEKLSERRNERKKKAVQYSGNKAEREQFENQKRKDKGDDSKREYAKHDNERAIAEAESKVTVITGKARNPRKYESNTLNRVGS